MTLTNQIQSALGVKKHALSIQNISYALPDLITTWLDAAYWAKNIREYFPTASHVYISTHYNDFNEREVVGVAVYGPDMKEQTLSDHSHDVFTMDMSDWGTPAPALCNRLVSLDTPTLSNLYSREQVAAQLRSLLDQLQDVPDECFQ